MKMFKLQVLFLIFYIAEVVLWQSSQLVNLRSQVRTPPLDNFFRWKIPVVQELRFTWRKHFSLNRELGPVNLVWEADFILQYIVRIWINLFQNIGIARGYKLVYYIYCTPNPLHKVSRLDSLKNFFHTFGLQQVSNLTSCALLRVEPVGFLQRYQLQKYHREVRLLET